MPALILIASKDVISRRNQDGTFILMRLDETNFFYKITGLAALAWAEFSEGRDLDTLLAHYGDALPEQRDEVVATLQTLFGQLQGYQLLKEAGEVGSASLQAQDVIRGRAADLGQVQEFNLEQIETEVLSESVYLDVFAGSDLRLKTDIQPLENCLEKVAQLDGVNFHWDPETSGGVACDARVQAGLIAQQVVMQMPELTARRAEDGFLAVNYSKMSAYLVEAIKELKKTVEAQEVRIRTLEAAARKSTDSTT